MAIKRILLPFDGSKHSMAAAQYALDVARAHDAEIEGLGLVDVGPIDRVERGGANVGGFAFAREARLSLLAQAQVHATEFQQAFVDQCRRAGVAYEYRFEIADPIERITVRSDYADLVVMGIRVDFDPDAGNESFEKLRDALEVAARPFLAVPVHVREVKRAVVALDFDRACDRLLFGLAHANPYPAAEFTVLHVGDAEAARGRLADALEYLAAHGVRAGSRVEVGKPIDVVPHVIQDEDFDLAVIGGNSGSRLAHFFFGSIARKVLERATCPVLTLR